MPPKKWTHEYLDSNLPPDTEYKKLADAIRELQVGGWDFLPESQLDENFQEWQQAAKKISLPEAYIADAERQIDRMEVKHAVNVAALETIFRSGQITSHRFKIDHPRDFPAYPPMGGDNRTAMEKALGIDDYIYLSDAGRATFSHRPETVSFIFSAQQIWEKQGTLVTPTDMPFRLTRHLFHERVPILQASILRATDYIRLLPRYIAAHKVYGEDYGNHVFPAWFTGQLGSPHYDSADTMVKKTLKLADHDWRVEGWASDATTIKYLEQHHFPELKDRVEFK